MKISWEQFCERDDLLFKWTPMQFCISVQFTTFIFYKEERYHERVKGCEYLCRSVHLKDAAKKKQFWHKWKYSNENGFRFRFWFCKIISVSLLRSFLWLRMFSYWSLWSTQAWRIVIWKLYSWKSGFIKSNVDLKRYQNYVFSKKYPPIQQPPSPQSSSLLPFSLTIFTSSIFEKLRTKMFTLTVVGSSENNWFKEMDYR